MFVSSWLNGLRGVLARVSLPSKAKPRVTRMATTRIEGLEERTLLSGVSAEVRTEDSMDHMYADLAARKADISPGQDRVRTNVTAGDGGDVHPNDVKVVDIITSTVSRGSYFQGGVRVDGTNLVGNVSTATISVQRGSSWIPLETVAVVSNTVVFADHRLKATKKNPVVEKVEFKFTSTFTVSQVGAGVHEVQGRLGAAKNLPPFETFTGGNLPDTVWTTGFGGGGGQTETAIPVLTGNPAIQPGATGTVGVMLNHAPLNTIVVTVASNNPNAVIEGQTQFTFTTANWNVAQNATIRNTSTSTTDVSATITGTDAAGSGSTTVTLKGTPTQVETAKPVLTGNPTVNLGQQGTFQLQLDHAPIGNVAVDVMSSNNAQGPIIGQSHFVFTPSNWNIPQTVTIRNDSTQADDQTVTVTAVASTGSSSANAVLKGTASVSGTVTFDALQLIAKGNALVISGQNPLYAGRTMSWWIDTDGDFNVDRLIGSAVADANGAFLIQLAQPVTLPSNMTLMEVRYQAPAQEGFHAAVFEKYGEVTNGGATVIDHRIGSGAHYDTMNPNLIWID